MGRDGTWPVKRGSDKDVPGRQVRSWTAVELRKAVRALHTLPDRSLVHDMAAEEPGGRLADDEHVMTGSADTEVIRRPATVSVRKHVRQAGAEPVAAGRLLPPRRLAEAGFEAEPG